MFVVSFSSVYVCFDFFIIVISCTSSFYRRPSGLACRALALHPITLTIVVFLSFPFVVFLYFSFASCYFLDFDFIILTRLTYAGFRPWTNQQDGNSCGAGLYASGFKALGSGAQASGSRAS